MTCTPSTPVCDERTTTEVPTPRAALAAPTGPAWGTITDQRLGTALAVAGGWNDRDGPRDVYVCQAPQAETFYCCTLPRGGTQPYPPVMTLRRETRPWSRPAVAGVWHGLPGAVAAASSPRVPMLVEAEVTTTISHRT